MSVKVSNSILPHLFYFSAWVVYRKMIIYSYYKQIEDALSDELYNNLYEEMNRSLESVVELRTPSEITHEA